MSDKSFKELVNSAQDVVDATAKKAQAKPDLVKPKYYFLAIGLMLLMFISVTLAVKNISSLHPSPSQNTINNGQKLSLLLIADEIIATQKKSGSLPKKIPSSPLNVELDIQYQVLDDKDFKLTLKNPNNSITFRYVDDMASFD